MKKVGTALYVHKSALGQLNEKITPIERKKIVQILSFMSLKGLTYEIIKFDRPKLSLIQSDNWNTAFEPDVGISFCFDISKSLTQYKVISPSGKIYHSKELFVNPNYTGFSVEQAKERTKLWNSIPNLDKKRIGNKKYWLLLLKQYNIPHE